VRRCRHVRGGGEVLGPRLVQRDGEGEGVGPDARDVGHFQQDGGVGLAVATVGSFGDVDGGVEGEPVAELIAEIEGRSHPYGHVAEMLDGCRQGIDGLRRLVFGVGVWRRVFGPRVGVEGVVDETDAHEGVSYCVI